MPVDKSPLEVAIDGRRTSSSETQRRGADKREKISVSPNDTQLKSECTVSLTVHPGLPLCLLGLADVNGPKAITPALTTAGLLYIVTVRIVSKTAEHIAYRTVSCRLPIGKRYALL